MRFILSPTVVLTLLVLVALGSCCNDSEFADPPIYEPGDMTYGSASAQKNGKEFMASVLGLRNPNDSLNQFYLIFTTQTSEGFLREKITIGHMFFEPMEYSTAPPCESYNPSFPSELSILYSTRADDGDVIEDKYCIDETYENKFKVNMVDTSTWVASGSFDLRFIITSTRPKLNPLNPDRVWFAEGVYEVKIQ